MAGDWLQMAAICKTSIEKAEEGAAQRCSFNFCGGQRRVRRYKCRVSKEHRPLGKYSDARNWSPTITVDICPIFWASLAQWAAVKQWRSKSKSGVANHRLVFAALILWSEIWSVGFWSHLFLSTHHPGPLQSLQLRWKMAPLEHTYGLDAMS